MDYAHPGGSKISLAVIRRRSPDAAHRVGTLIVNPGGPGVSGRQMVTDGFGEDNGLAAYFDLVSWDTRGSGASAPLRCDDHVAAFQALDPNPSSPAAQTALDTAAQRIATDCGARGGELLRHMDTDTTARDLEQLRLALGGDKLSYAGYSYGTAIGLAYARRYPTHIRAMVLDGVVPPNWDLTRLLGVQAAAIERRLGDVLRCPVAGRCPTASAGAAYDSFERILAKARMPASGGRSVGADDLATAASMATYDPRYAVEFLHGLSAMANGDGTGIADLAALYRTEVTSDAAYLGVVCTDLPHPQGATAYAAFATSLAQRFPRVGGGIANEVLPCAFWPAPVARTVGVVRAADAPSILVVGNTGDAVTPMANSTAVADELAHGVLLILKGQGHTSVSRSVCIGDAELRYLAFLTVPASGTECDS
jgi:pimeloyl-ACP methyl ester carboxylesterase